ncbi:MAG: dihydroneopterin aldolase [Pseudomonadales bacterium]
MDIVFIRQLEIQTIIGIFEWERMTKQKVYLDVDMAVDIGSAAQSDHIDNTVSYKSVSDDLLEFVGSSDFQLVETMAEEIAQRIQTKFNVPWVRLRVTKPTAILDAGGVGVLIERGERPAIASYGH